jgi:hypothetical protein
MLDQSSEIRCCADLKCWNTVNWNQWLMGPAIGRIIRKNYNQDNILFINQPSNIPAFHFSIVDYKTQITQY